jgi:hypothetical protein
MRKLGLHHSQKKKFAETCARIIEAKEKMATAMADDPIKVDANYVFQLYATFCGDVERTAAACGLQPIDVLQMARDDDWQLKLASIIKLKKSGRPGDVERAISRAMNFVQAHRMRLFLDRVVSKLTGFSEEELLKYMMTTTVKTAKDGTVSETTALNARPFADLTASLEKVHHMLYMALADSTAERDRKRESGNEEASSAEIHAAIADAMANVGRQSPVGAAILNAQTAMAEERINEGVMAGVFAPNGQPINLPPRPAPAS